MKVIIEIPKGTRNKYELKGKKLTLDRVLTLPYPYSYGFFPKTLAGDGDPIDVFVLSDVPIYPGTEVDVEVLGLIKMFDQGEEDNKVVARITKSPHSGGQFSQAVARLRTFLMDYKSGTEVGAFKNKKYAEAYIKKGKV